MQKKRVTVIGAGIVGVSCALWAQKRGHVVTLIDKDPAGAGTSSGNACTIADYAGIPVNSPGLITALPGLMLRKDSPLSIDFAYAITNLNWMLQFLWNCRRSRVDQTIAHLGRLLQATYAGLDPLVDDCNARHLFQKKGCLYAYEKKSSFDAAAADNQRRKDNGVEFEVLGTSDIRDREPHLKPDFYCGLLFSNASQTVNPQTLVTTFFDQFIANGGEYIQQKVASIDATGLTVELDDGATHIANKIVIAAGAFAKTIRGSGVDKLPLDTERGYHVQYKNQQSLLSAPVGWAEGGFYAVPMDQGLRLAGTVEIAGLEKPANQSKIDYLKGCAEKLFDITEQPDQTWLGFRPTMPDSLPVIGPSPLSPDILCAFGHHHLGLTLGGITGKLVSELIDGVEPELDIAAFSASRF